MARSDWSRYGAADTNHSIDTATVYEGSGALKIDDSTITSMDILTISEEESPTDGEFKTWVYTGNANRAPCFFYRFQDVNNYYVFSADYTDGDLKLRFGKVVGGTYAEIGRSVASFSPFETDGWSGPHKFSCWTDSIGDVRARWVQDVAQDGNGWHQVGSDIVDSSPDLGTGGGVGVGGEANIRVNSASQSLDATEVYY